MSEVYGELVVNLANPPVAVEHFLVEPHRHFVYVNFFYVACTPSGPTGHVEPVPPTAIGQFFPCPEFPLVLRTFLRIHRVECPHFTVCTGVRRRPEHDPL